MKTKAIVKIEIENPNKLECHFFTLIVNVENDSTKYAWLDTDTNVITPTWFDTIPEARKFLFDYFNGEYLFSIEFIKKEM